MELIGWPSLDDMVTWRLPASQFISSLDVSQFCQCLANCQKEFRATSILSISIDLSLETRVTSEKPWDFRQNLNSRPKTLSELWIHSWLQFFICCPMNVLCIVSISSPNCTFGAKRAHPVCPKAGALKKACCRPPIFAKSIIWLHCDMCLTN